MTMGLGLAILSRTNTAAEAFNPASIRCFAAPALTQPVKTSVHTAAPDVAAMRAAVAPLTDDALNSARACAGSACTGAQSATLTHAVSRYLDTRRRMTADLYQQHRMHGLAIADEVFGGARTQALSELLAGLHAQGDLDPGHFGVNRDALSLLISKPAQSFRPCEPARVNRDLYWYVY